MGQINFNSATGSNYFYCIDKLGSVRELTNSSGTIVSLYGYDPYGVVNKISGSQDADFQYAGYYSHMRSGLNMTWFRQYSASLGRWLSRDPIGEAGDLNIYSYVGGNPIRYLDPLGLLTCVQVARLLDGGCNYSGKTVAGTVGTQLGTEFLLCMAFRESTPHSPDNFEPSVDNTEGSGAKGLLQIYNEQSASQVGAKWSEMSDPAKNLRAGSMLAGYYVSKFGLEEGISKFGGGDPGYLGAIQKCEKCLKAKKTRCDKGCLQKSKGG